MSRSKEFVSSLPKQYDAGAIEDRWYAHWEGAGLFRAEPGEGRRPFTIVIPPPNITGILHMGHALNNTLQDILVRYRRMTGRETLWLPGTDHAGIATQNVVEKELAKEGIRREDLGRDRFLERVWEWKEQYGRTIVKQLRKLGSSCDWSRERFTLDAGLSRAVREVFVRLYESGLIYRGRRLIHWCPRCHSALSDDEVEHEEIQGQLWHIRYPLKNARQSLVVATTRPETMLGDTAVAVHPQDDRYGKYIGSTVVLPVLGREIPVIADEMVDPAFGTGAVKVTPAHDPNDYECGLRHNLEEVIVIGPDGTMTEAAGKYAGLDRFRCRELLVRELEELKLLETTEAHVHAVGHCYRCQSVVEPTLTEQWFVRMRPLAELAFRATAEEKVRFHPARWEKVYLAWLENVRDWCISRQIWWGHRLPVWYCEDCAGVTVAREDPSRCGRCRSERIRQDEDVLDTWFSSALWPFSTLGWPEEAEDLRFFYPTDVLVTDRGIIYFWVARMVMMGLYFQEDVPFRDVYIHGTILDDQGRKMSKSLGNGIDPLEMIEAYGADAVRFTLTALTTEGQDIRLAPTRFELGRNFINKFWNASRFALMKLSEVEGGDEALPEEALAFEDRWILDRLAAASEAATAALEGFKYSELATVLREFTWHDLCDWYLEIVKDRLASSGETSRVAGRVLAAVLDVLLRLLHPILPFVTEEIWHLLARVAERRGLEARPAPARPDLIRAPWPRGLSGFRNAPVEGAMRLTQDVIRSIRNLRSKFNIPPRAEIAVLVSAADEAVRDAIADRLDLVRRLSGAGSVEVGVGLPKPAQAASEVMERLHVYVPLSGLMDFDLERRRLLKEREKKEAFLAKSTEKLRNAEYLKKAKPDVIERERALKTDLETQIAKLDELLASLAPSVEA
ncbi:MAG: valine--tRNA ligase [Planctomycetota bacterium]